MLKTPDHILRVIEGEGICWLIGLLIASQILSRFTNVSFASSWLLSPARPPEGEPSTTLLLHGIRSLFALVERFSIGEDSYGLRKTD